MNDDKTAAEVLQDQRREAYLVSARRMYQEPDPVAVYLDWKLAEAHVELALRIRDSLRSLPEGATATIPDAVLEKFPFHTRFWDYDYFTFTPIPLIS